MESGFIGLAVEDGDFGVGGDADQGGLGLDTDAHAEKRGELAGGFGNGDNGAAIGDAEDFAVLAAVADQVAGAETVECVHGVRSRKRPLTLTLSPDGGEGRASE